MELTNENIRDLYKFTQQHFVEHYDVQTELVDHLANDIENICDENSKLTFTEARDIAFKKFGVFGFMNMYEEKQKQIGKKYRRILLNLLKEWFTFPKIVITLSLVLLFHNLYKIITLGGYFYYAFQIGFFLFIIIKCRIMINKHKKKVALTGKNWLLEDIIYKLASSNFLIFFTQFYNIVLFGEKLDSRLWIFTVAVLSTTLILLAYVTLILIPSKSEEIMQEHYPSYKLV